jgi:hypothetical protein|tara:strand:+ start:169 stop:321 length:153 start_codon:yes stop_codon:yes gene_type:complete
MKKRNPIARELLLCGQYKHRVVSDKTKYNRKKDKKNVKDYEKKTEGYETD